MNVNRLFLAGLLGALLATGPARAQGYLGGFTDPRASNAVLPRPGVQDGDPEPRYQLSDWVTNASKDYQPPEGVVLHPAPAVGTEIFLRSGPSVPFGSGIYAATLDVGWMIDFGARALFFNPEHDRAWIIEGSISNTYNAANSSTSRSPISLNLAQNGVIAPQTVTIRDLDQTFANVGFGRDWYWHPAGTHGTISFGVDVGGRW